ncbi:MAG: cell division protein FtsA [Patescibacteria group bacterium]
MARIFTGIDIGTSHIKVMVATPTESPDGALRILGTGVSQARGMHHGYIINAPEVVQGIREAVDRASQAAGIKITSARISVGGIGIEELHSNGDVSLTASGGEVTSKDITRATSESEKKVSSKLVNKRVLHTIPLAYRIDNIPIQGRPSGVKGTRFSVDTLLVTVFDQHVQDIITAVEAAHIEVEGEMASPLAAGLATLSKAQKMAGVVLGNIGAETVSIAVFENDTPISIKVFPTGSSAITHDLALSFKIPLVEAEQVKRGAVTNSDLPRKKVDDIIAKKLHEIFSLIDAHLKTIGRQRLLPAGIVITGGGSGLAGITDAAKATLKLPAQVGTLAAISARSTTTDATWAVAYGLCKWGYITEERITSQGFSKIKDQAREYFGRIFRSLLP